MEEVHGQLLARDRLMLISGMGGIGKTALALEYHSRYRQAYANIAWVSFRENLAESFLSTALPQNLQIDPANYASTALTFRALKAAMANLPGRHLLIIDNLNDPDFLRADQLHIPNWNILLTSRAQSQDTELPTQRIPHLTAGKAAELFSEYYPPAKEQPDLLQRLLSAIDYHTLTIELLAKNLARWRGRYSLGQLCDDLEARGVLQLEKTRAVLTNYHSEKAKPEAIIRSMFDLTALAEDAPKLQLLQRLALLPPEFIPLGHLARMFGQPEDTLLEVLDDLAEQGWLEHSPDTGERYKLHQLIQAVVHERYPPPAELSAGLAEHLKRILDHDHLTKSVDYLDYARYLADRGAEPPPGLCLSITDRLMDIGRLSETIPYINQARAGYAAQGDQSNEAVCLERLGSIYKAKGQFDQALEFFLGKPREALYASNAQNEGLKNGLAISYEKLGDIYKAKGQFDQALEFFLKVTDLFEALYASNAQNEGLKNGLAISYLSWGISIKRRANSTKPSNSFAQNEGLKDLSIKRT